MATTIHPTIAMTPATMAALPSTMPTKSDVVPPLSLSTSHQRAFWGTERPRGRYFSKTSAASTSTGEECSSARSKYSRIQPHAISASAAVAPASGPLTLGVSRAITCKTSVPGLPASLLNTTVASAAVTRHHAQQWPSQLATPMTTSRCATTNTPLIISRGLPESVAPLVTTTTMPLVQAGTTGTNIAPLTAVAPSNIAMPACSSAPVSAVPLVSSPAAITAAPTTAATAAAPVLTSTTTTTTTATTLGGVATASHAIALDGGAGATSKALVGLLPSRATVPACTLRSDSALQAQGPSASPGHSEAGTAAGTVGAAFGVGVGVGALKQGSSTGQPGRLLVRSSTTLGIASLTRTTIATAASIGPATIAASAAAPVTKSSITNPIVTTSNPTCTVGGSGGSTSSASSNISSSICTINASASASTSCKGTPMAQANQAVAVTSSAINSNNLQLSLPNPIQTSKSSAINSNNLQLSLPNSIQTFKPHARVPALTNTALPVQPSVPRPRLSTSAEPAPAKPTPEGKAVQPLKGTIICFGDSLTLGNRDTGLSYPKVLEALLRGDGHDVEVKNLGIWGDPTAKMTQRLPQAIAEAAKSSRLLAVLILGGTNDILRDLGSTQDILGRLRHLHGIAANAPYMPLVGILTLPKMKHYSDPNHPRCWVNDALRRMTAEKASSCLGLNRHFLVDLDLVDVNLTSDGIHYTDQGYTEFATLAYQSMKPMLARLATDVLRKGRQHL